MSFLGGAECSTAGNPLTQFTKHTQDDKSLQRDRLVGRGPPGHFESMRSQIPMGQHDKVSDAIYEYLISCLSSALIFPKLMEHADDGRVLATT